MKTYSDKKLVGHVNVLCKGKNSGGAGGGHPAQCSTSSGLPVGKTGNGVWFPELPTLLSTFISTNILIHATLLICGCGVCGWNV